CKFKEMDRRNFLKAGSVAAVGATMLNGEKLFAKNKSSIRVGFIGVGLRGRNHVAIALRRDDVQVVAICDTQEDSLARCRKQFKEFKKKAPKEYTGGVDAYKRMLEKEKLDAVIIATPWQFHHSQAVDSMKAGVYVGCEVIAGLTLEEHWDIVKVSEATGVPYRSEEHTSELQSRENLVCRLLLEKKKNTNI